MMISRSAYNLYYQNQLSQESTDPSIYQKFYARLKEALNTFSKKEDEANNNDFSEQLLIYNQNVNPQPDKFQRLFRHYLLLALKGNSTEQLIKEVSKCDKEYQNIAVEALAMGIGILDHMFLPQSKRWLLLNEHFASSYSNALYAGLGMSLAKLGLAPSPYLINFAPKLRQIIMEGYGFYSGYFTADKFLNQKQTIGNLLIEEQNAFDQGLGKSLWFHYQGNLKQIYAHIETFARYRQPHLLSGLDKYLEQTNFYTQLSK